MYDTFSAEVQSHNDLLSYARFFQLSKSFHKKRLRLFSFWDRKCDLISENLSKKKVYELFGLKSRDICLREDFLLREL